MLTELAREKRLDLVVSCHPDVPAVLSGDPTRLAQVMTNLVSNAVKFTEHGGVDVRATAEPDDDRVRLRVEVADTGVGVPRSKRSHLFEPFTQGDSSTTRIYGGTGLGLAISSELVDAMGGTLEYTANPGGGSVFTCTVVLDQGVESAAANPGDVMARELLHGRRALVVADEPHGSVLTEQLAWWGVRSDRVATAAEAHPLLDGAAYDVVLVDGPDPGTLGEVSRSSSSPRRTWPATSGSPCCGCWPASRAPTRSSSRASSSRARAGSSWSRTTRSTSWSRPGCWRRWATPPTPRTTGWPPSRRPATAASTRS